MKNSKYVVNDPVFHKVDGRVGTIVSVGFDYEYEVRWNGESQTEEWVHELALTAALAENVELAHPDDDYEFKVGDRVVADDGGSGQVIQVEKGSIRASYSVDRVKVKIDGKPYSAWYGAPNLQLDVYEGSSLNREAAVNHPAHYTSDPSGIECIEVTRHRNFNIGNAMKYLWRNGLKDADAQVEDLRKAIWYIEDEIKRLENV